MISPEEISNELPGKKGKSTGIENGQKFPKNLRVSKNAMTEQASSSKDISKLSSQESELQHDLYLPKTAENDKPNATDELFPELHDEALLHPSPPESLLNESSDKEGEADFTHDAMFSKSTTPAGDGPNLFVCADLLISDKSWLVDHVFHNVCIESCLAVSDRSGIGSRRFHAQLSNVAFSYWAKGQK